MPLLLSLAVSLLVLVNPARGNSSRTENRLKKRRGRGGMLALSGGEDPHQYASAQQARKRED